MRSLAEKSKFELAPEELLLFSNVLNEICNGLELQNFDRVIGARELEVCGLSDRLRMEPRQSAGLTVSEHELNIFQNALRETLRELGPEEFSTRTGVDFDLAQEILLNLKRDDSGE